MSGAKGRLEEGGAEHLDPAFAHPGVALPLAALAQARVVAHKGLESCGDFAIASGVQNLSGQPGQDLGDVDWSKAGPLAAARSGSATESAAKALRAAAFGRTIQFFSKVERRLPAMAAGVGAWMSNWRIPTPSNWSSPPNSGKLRSIRL